jgi:hypothetical protein
VVFPAPESPTSARLVAVAEHHLLEDQVAARRGRDRPLRPGHLLGRLVEDLLDALGRAGRRGEQQHELGQVAHRLVEQLRVGQEHDERADREAARGDGQERQRHLRAGRHECPDRDDDDLRDRHQQQHDRAELRLAPPRTQRGAPLGPGLAVEQRRDPRLDRVALDLRDRVDRLGAELRDAACRARGVLRGPLDPARVDAHDHEQQRRDAHRQQGELPADREHHREDPDEQQQARQQVDEPVGDQLLDVGDVAAHPLDQVADPPAAVPAEREALEVGEQPAPQPGAGVLAHERGDPQLCERQGGPEGPERDGGHPREQDDAEGARPRVAAAEPGGERAGEPGGVPTVDDLVEDELQRERREHVAGGRDDRHRDRDADEHPVPLEAPVEERDHDAFRPPPV